MRTWMTLLAITGALMFGACKKEEEKKPADTKPATGAATDGKAAASEPSNKAVTPAPEKK